MLGESGRGQLREVAADSPGLTNAPALADFLVVFVARDQGTDEPRRLTARGSEATKSRP